VVDTLRKVGLSAPINQKFVDLALAIESGTVDAKPENTSVLVD